MSRPQALEIEAVFAQAAGLEILDQHVGAGGEPAHDRLALGRLEIHRDRALAAIAGVEIGGVEPLARRAFDEGRAPAAGIVAGARPLDLDDVGAEIGEALSGPGAGEDAREFEDFEAGERFQIGGSVDARQDGSRQSRNRRTARLGATALRAVSGTAFRRHNGAPFMPAR